MEKKITWIALLLPQLAWAALPFATVEVAYHPVGGAYVVDALVEAGRESTLAAQVAGRILELRVDAGNVVKQGQLIARIDDAETRQSVAGNQAQVVQAQAELANMQSQYERTKQLVARKFVSESALDQARANFEAAQAKLAVTKAGVAQVSATRSFSTISAPFPGLISARHAQAGDMASLGRPLVSLFDPATLRVVASIPQSRLEEVRKSGHVRVELMAQNKWIEAESVTVLPEADSKTHVSQVRIEVPKNFAGIYPGMFARAHFAENPEKKGSQKMKMMVPVQAIVQRSEVTGVYVVSEGERIQFRQVRLGEGEDSGHAEILAGLMAGERIALEPVKAGIYLKGYGVQH